VRYTYIVAWTIANAEAPMVRAVEMTEAQADEIEHQLTEAECFPSVERLDTLLSFSPDGFEGLKRII
jgi:hypothetical protein